MEFDLAAFRAERLGQLDSLRDLILPAIRQSFVEGEAPDHDMIMEAAVAALNMAHDELGLTGTPDTAKFLNDIEHAVMMAGPDSSPDRIATWIATAAYGAAIYYGTNFEATKTWITMQDDDVRDLHRPHHGETILVNERFDIGGSMLSYPGQPVGPPEVWINCRCVLAMGLTNAELDSLNFQTAVPLTAAADDPWQEWEDQFDDEDEPAAPGELYAIDFDNELAWHGLLVIEGRDAGDNRSFAENALTWRELPLPLKWQKVGAEEHAGDVIVGRIDRLIRRGNEIWGEGVYADIPEADEVMGLVAGKFLRGVSVEVDDIALEMPEDVELEEHAEGGVITMPRRRFAKGRVTGATQVATPAFPECFLALGPLPLGMFDEEVLTAGACCESCRTGNDTCESEREHFVSEKPWDGSASRFTDEQYCRSCILHLETGCTAKSKHKLPIREPGGALSRAGVHAAAARLNQVDAPPEAIARAKRALRTAYRQLGEEPPDVITAAGNPFYEPGSAAFARGRGWITHPRETKRIHDYWVSGKGRAKIRWGTGGDFTRCTRYLRKYISPTYLNRTCAQWHHDALGYWPGELGKPGNPPNTPENRRRAARHAHSIEGNDMAALATQHIEVEVSHTHTPLFSLAAAARPQMVYDADHFLNPGFSAPTRMKFERDGRFYGHLAAWGMCHIGIEDRCVLAPRSRTDYSYFHTGSTETTDGELAVGRITMSTLHADLSLGFADTVRHYEDTGAIAGVCRMGEDAHGIWVAGHLALMDEADLFALTAAGGLSGDWRLIGGNLELVAALVVNVPGFPIPRPALAASGQRETALVAANMLVPDVDDDMTERIIAAMDERDRRAQRHERVRRLRAIQMSLRCEELLRSR